MAVKKPIKKRDTTNPNTALVLFLVFFILLSIGLGVWGYYGYSGQAKLREDGIAAQKDRTAAKLGEDYANWVVLEHRQALGHDLTPAEKETLESRRKKAPEDFKGEPTYAGTDKWIKEMNEQVGTSSFRKLVTELRAERDKLQGDLAKAQKDLKDEIAKYEALAPKIDAYWKTALKNIDTAAKDAQKIALNQPDEMDKAIKALKTMQKEKEEMEESFRQAKAKLEAEKKLMREQLDKIKEELATTTPALAARAAILDPHALLLDISTGKPLWDDPIAKITRVDLREQQVFIDIGSARGVRPELTFNVFAPGFHGRAEKGLKGTIEVQRVLDANTAVARIIALYDVDGFEIGLNDPNRLRREAAFPMKEGDLLFNMAWGTHVIVAGPVNWTGLPGDAPADMIRQQQAFISLIERMGVSVDAHLDLASGELRGAITPKTRFMIRGDVLPVDKEGKPEVNKRINDAVQAIRKEAVDRGMFIISSDNFATVIGFRRPRLADDDRPPFRPTVPYSGSPVQSPRVSAPDAPAAPAEPPMEKEKKEKEKMEKGEKVEKEKN